MTATTIMISASKLRDKAPRDSWGIGRHLGCGGRTARKKRRYARLVASWKAERRKGCGRSQLGWKHVYSEDSTSIPHAFRRVSGMNFEFLLRLAHSRS